MHAMSDVVAVVLARGHGHRMRRADTSAHLTPDQEAAAEAGGKVFMPFRGHRYLDYVLSSLADAGYRRAGLVIGPEHRVSCQPYIAPGRSARVSVELIEQPQARGTADAVRSAETWVDHSPFVVLNGDNLYPVPVLRDLARLNGPGLAGFARDQLVQSGGLPPSRIQSFALISVDDFGHLSGIVEKPTADQAEAAGPSALVSMNCWRFDDRMFSACAEVAVSARGEYELPDAVMLARERGVQFTVIRGTGPVLDLSSRADIPEVDRHLAGVEPRP